MLQNVHTDTVVRLRDRALLGLMIYSCARIRAAAAIRVKDFRLAGTLVVRQAPRGGGGLAHEVPTHHNHEAWLHSYIEAAGIADNVVG